MKIRQINLHNLIIELFSLGFVIANILFVFLRYSGLPERIITHYNIKGLPDGYGDKSDILILTGISILIYVVFTVLERFPQIYNYPVKVTENNRDELHYYAMRMMKYIKLSICVIFFFIAFASIENKPLGTAFTWLTFIAPTIILVYYIYKMMSTNRS